MLNDDNDLNYDNKDNKDNKNKNKNYLNNFFIKMIFTLQLFYIVYIIFIVLQMNRNTGGNAVGVSKNAGGGAGARAAPQPQPQEDDFFESDNVGSGSGAPEVIQSNIKTNDGVLTNENIRLYNRFEDMGLEGGLLRSIYSNGFERPSDIQKKAIVPIISGRNLISQAQSGTGKTGAFLIGSLQRIDREIKSPQVIVVTPTRELAKQIRGVAVNLTRYYPVDYTLLIGGEGSTNQPINSQLLIGTPGRIMDVITNGLASMTESKIIIMDEADKMLSIGFRKQIATILSFMNPTIQILLFSATMSDEVVEMASKFVRDPVRILVDKSKISLEGIKQFYVYFQREQMKMEALVDIYSSLPIGQSIIFTNYIEKTILIYERMKTAGYPVYYIHSDMTQQERNEIMEDFVSGKIRVLITTDILARGIDVQQVSLVVNFDVSREVDTYLHRVGRSGRWARKGIAINFVVYKDMKYLRDVERYYNISIPTLPANLQTLNEE